MIGLATSHTSLLSCITYFLCYAGTLLTFYLVPLFKDKEISGKLTKLKLIVVKFEVQPRKLIQNSGSQTFLVCGTITKLSRYLAAPKDG